MAARLWRAAVGGSNPRNMCRRSQPRTAWSGCVTL